MKLNMNRTKTLMLCAFSVIAVTVSIPSAQADGAGAFLGGIAVARIGQNIRDDRDDRDDQEDYARQQDQAAQQRASKPTAEEQLAQLQDLAAKGYITPEEYKAKKKAILDAM